MNLEEIARPLTFSSATLVSIKFGLNGWLGVLEDAGYSVILQRRRFSPRTQFPSHDEHGRLGHPNISRFVSRFPGSNFCSGRMGERTAQGSNGYGS